jgi:hypothetical protein
MFQTLYSNFIEIFDGLRLLTSEVFDRVRLLAAQSHEFALILKILERK